MKLNLIIEQAYRLQSIRDMAAMLPQLLKAAQAVYDQWAQDDDGYDDEYGGGGICHDIADAMVGVLTERSIDAMTFSQAIGDVHVYVIAKFAEGVYELNIPPYIYERGSGYSWTKLPNVVFKENDVIVNRIHTDPSKFDEYLDS